MDCAAIDNAGEEFMTEWLMIAFTFFVTIFTGCLAFITHKISKHTVASERAYVKMSHKPPGIIIEQEPSILVSNEPFIKLQISIEVKNSGRTPATVTDVILNNSILPKKETLPVIPKYHLKKDRSENKAFLVDND